MSSLKRTADLAVIHGHSNHTTGASLAEHLRAIASRVALAGDIAEVMLFVDLQVVSAPHSPATDALRAATVDVLAELLDETAAYDRDTGHYGTVRGGAVKVYGAMKPPARLLESGELVEGAPPLASLGEAATEPTAAPAPAAEVAVVPVGADRLYAYLLFADRDAVCVAVARRDADRRTWIVRHGDHVKRCDGVEATRLRLQRLAETELAR